jgi:hypothetical protein
MIAQLLQCRVKNLDGRYSKPGNGMIFLYSATSRPDVVPTQPPIQWALRTLSSGLKRMKREADH